MAGFFTHRQFKLSDTPDLSGKIALITGGQAGIGREITAQLLLHGVTQVYILARSQLKYAESTHAWTTKHSIAQEEVEIRTEFVQCDLGSIKDVSRVANQLLNRLDRLDILINNAAMAVTPDYRLGPDGVEIVFATNYVGHFILTNILLPLIEQTAAAYGGARIVNTSSSLHMICQNLNLDDLRSPTNTKSPAFFDGVWRYGRSKLANILFTRELSSRLQKKGASNIYVNSLFPGNIPTEAMDTWKQVVGPVLGTLIKGTFQLIGQSVTDGAATAVFLAASPEVERRAIKARYLVPIAAEHKTSSLAGNKDMAQNLWYWTDHLATERLGQGWSEARKHGDT